MTSNSAKACAMASTEPGRRSTISATWVIVKTKTRSKKSSSVETRSSRDVLVSGMAERQLRLGRPVRGIDAVEQAAGRFPAVDPVDGLGEQGSDRAHRELGPVGDRYRHRVGGEHLGDAGVVAQPLQRLAGEQSVRARDSHARAVLLGEPVEQLDDRPAGGDLVVED